MAIYLNGIKHNKIYFGGQEFTGLFHAGSSFIQAADELGSLTVSASRARGRTTLTIRLSDPNGIRAVSSATLTARDGTTATITGDLARADANTFTDTDSRANARWNRGSLSVTYVDAASGNSHTLTQTWTV